MMNPNNDRERTEPFPGPNARSQAKVYRFSPDEVRVLRECNRESFYQRCVPLGTLLGGLTYYAIKTGKLNPSPRLGVIPKVAASVIVGYFVGKFSYQQKCAEKLMAMPDSKIGQMLRARKSGNAPENLEPGFTPGMSLNPFGGIPDSYTDIPPLNKDFDYGSRPQPDGLDDSFRPTIDNPIIIHDEELPPEQKHITNYEELRQKNREEYEQKRLSSYRESARAASSPAASSAAAQPPTQGPTGPKNKYGDVWG